MSSNAVRCVWGGGGWILYHIRASSSGTMVWQVIVRGTHNEKYGISSDLSVYVVSTLFFTCHKISADSPSPSLSVSRCVDHACSPPIGNLASGRALFALSHRCGNSSSLHLCPDDTHPPALMTDDPFLHPDTWWASGAQQQQQQQRDEIRLDLETRFCLSHVILVFRSPRPAAMAIERSADFGKTWEALKLYAQNCSADFGLPDDFSQPGSLCTSRYSSASPCTGGEVRTHTQMCDFMLFCRC